MGEQKIEDIIDRRSPRQKIDDVLEETLTKIKTRLETQVGEIPEFIDQILFLSNTAYSNKSSWSGGTDSGTNIEEKMYREVAIEMMAEIILQEKRRIVRETKKALEV